MDDSSSTPQKQQDPLPMSIDPTTTTSPLRGSRTRLADRLLEPEIRRNPPCDGGGPRREEGHRRRSRRHCHLPESLGSRGGAPSLTFGTRRTLWRKRLENLESEGTQCGPRRKIKPGAPTTFNPISSKYALTFRFLMFETFDDSCDYISWLVLRFWLFFFIFLDENYVNLWRIRSYYYLGREGEEEEEEEENGGDLERVGQVISDLIMWKDVAKSTLWFGFGSLCLLSSCFSKGLNFSIFSAMSQLAIVFLGVSFVLNTICQRNQVEKKREFKLKEDDILHLAKLILPTLNLTISVTRELFSGEPSMTLKVAPFLLLGAEYGHFITIWRLCAIGFLISFTAPKLYSCYTEKINQRADRFTLWLLDIWCTCTHKKKLVVSALMAFWNLSSIKTRIYTGSKSNPNDITGKC
ncbi:uncharacterized protein LOC130945870 [Arachis stenosperma]|uniref:uncharacterized protein LOC130945870 n=1 Tax=Arachis stenosperma TaxID=217475 RepID=UPI0025AC5E2D|nr:uncharacterized protein LOC130945870 [Arachis stenosperma]